MRMFTKIAIAVSMGWLILLGGLAVAQINWLTTAPLNEVGDFLAGAFSPLAFLWLVVGFFQQGEELKRSTEALELQARELNLNVQQQAELVKVGRDELALSQEALRQADAREQRQLQPRLRLKVKSRTGGYGSQAEVVFELQNFGHSITELAITSTEVESNKSRISALDSNTSTSLTITVPPDFLSRFQFQIAFLDGGGNDRVCRFICSQSVSSIYDVEVHTEA